MWNRKLSTLFFTRKGSRALIFVLAVLIVMYEGVDQISKASLPEVRGQVMRLFDTLSPEVLPASQAVQVKRVVDGDTIELETGEKVRYIGINAPESVKPHADVECFGKESSAKNKQLVEGKYVYLEKDVSEKDRYGRLLRFVYLEDGTFVNDWLVREGYAYASTFPPDVSRAEQFVQAQREARENGRGLWAKDTCDGKK